jgi:hypothetical protein
MLATYWRRLVASGLIVFSTAAVLAGADEAEVAADADAAAAIAKLLEVGWPGNLQSRTAADAHYQEVVLKMAAGDPRALKASWLVLMQQRRFDEALKRIDEHLAEEPDNQEAQRAKAWNAAILKNYAASMLAADKLGQQLEELPPITEADRAAYEESVAFLGRLYGFFGGPAAENVNQDQRKAAEKQVVGRIDEAFRPVFVEARDGVLKQYIELTDDKAVERDRAVETAETEKAKTLDDVAAEREQIAAREAELEERRAKLQAELKDEFDELEKQDRPLAQDLTRLEVRANALRRDLVSYQIDIDRLDALAAGEEDPARRQQYRFEADRLALVASRIDSELFSVNRLGRNVQQQRAALVAQGAQAQANAAAQVARMDNELKDLAKRDKRAGGIEKRATRPTSATTSKVRSLAAQATALSTYDPFPLEAARARLLESLK